MGERRCRYDSRLFKMTKEEVLAIIDAELQGNLQILIDPKQKDSFSQMRINTWKDTVKERLYYHLIEREK
jgi:hypothetical protein